MHPLPTRCPLCSGEISITKIHCNVCDTTLEGRFTAGTFANLTLEQLEFVEIFVRNEGKINRMEAEMGLSYPTIRNRLHEVIRAMGYEPGESETPKLSDQDRRQILEDLEAGVISYEVAMQMLEDGGS